MAHAILSPSAAHRWMSCPGSTFLTKDLPPPPASVHAQEGTRAHAKAEEILRARLTGEPIPDVIEGFPELGQYVHYVDDLIRNGYSVFIEVRVPLFGITTEDDAKGTADCVAIKGDEIEVVDLKWGVGVPVESRENPQLSIYALAAMDEFDYLGPFKRARLTIVQPRVNEAPSSWDVEVEDLERFRSTVKMCASEAIAMREELTAPVYHPSKKACRWCAANKTCRAYAEMVRETTSLEFPDLGENPILDNETRAELFRRLDDVRAWVETFEAGVLADALAGVKFPGLKLVRGRAGARKWSDEQTADDLLAGFSVSTEDRYERKLLSPTSVEKLYKGGLINDEQWEQLKKLVTRSEPKLILASDSDKREAVTVDTASQFDDLTK